MFFGLTANQKQSRSALRDALAEIDRAKPEDRRRVADSLATLAENERNPALAGEILGATRHLRPSAIDEHVLTALIESIPDATLGRHLNTLAAQCLAGGDAAGLRLVGAAQRSLGDRLALAESRRKAFIDRQQVRADLARRAESRRLNRRADDRRASTWGALLG